MLQFIVTQLVDQNSSPDCVYKRNSSDSEPDPQEKKCYFFLRNDFARANSFFFIEMTIKKYKTRFTPEAYRSLPTAMS